MRNYYTAIIFLNVFAMLTVRIGIERSNTLPNEKKRLFKYLFQVIIVASICEWAGEILQGSGNSTRILHTCIKAMELSIAPFSAFLVSLIIDGKHEKEIGAFLGVHALLEVISAFAPFIYFVDNSSTYVHGNYYWIYVFVYIISILYCFWVVANNVRRYQYNGIGFFLLIVLFMICGLSIQMLNSAIKVDYIALGISAIMLYIFTLEMVNQTDELTELINRRGYENYISHLDHPFEILFFDVDGFKTINDTYGHKMGDDVLKTIGVTIRDVYARYGKCFRYGGDEFCVILYSENISVDQLNHHFKEEIERQKNLDERFPSVSIGHAFCDPYNKSIQDIFNEAEKMMYEIKLNNKR